MIRPIPRTNEYELVCDRCGFRIHHSPHVWIEERMAIPYQLGKQHFCPRCKHQELIERQQRENAPRRRRTTATPKQRR
jgi:rRNA maturation endonuclease Nob1